MESAYIGTELNGFRDWEVCCNTRISNLTTLKLIKKGKKYFQIININKETVSKVLSEENYEFQQLSQEHRNTVAWRKIHFRLRSYLTILSTVFE